MPGFVILMASANQELINTILKIRDDQLSNDTTIGPLSKELLSRVVFRRLIQAAA